MLRENFLRGAQAVVGELEGIWEMISTTGTPRRAATP